MLRGEAIGRIRGEDYPSQDIVSHHVGAPGSPHMPGSGIEQDRDMPRKVRMLAAKFGLEWCVQCGDWHEIAGGPDDATRTMMTGMSMREPVGPGGMDGI